jgi:hypothetical protein
MEITKIIHSIISLLDKFQEVKYTAKRELYVEFTRLKKKLAIKLFQTFFYCIALGLLITGLIIFFARFFPLDAVFIGIGLISAYVASMLHLYYK